MIFDLGIESVACFGEIALYGPLWLIEFRDYTQAIVVSGDYDRCENYVFGPEER